MSSQTAGIEKAGGYWELEGSRELLPAVSIVQDGDILDTCLVALTLLEIARLSV